MERGKAKKEGPSIQEVSDTNNSKDEISITILEEKEPLHRLPSMLKRMNLEPENLEPMVVSLGPYHHGKEHLQVTVDDKRKARDQLLQGKIAENFYKETRLSMEAARKLYVDDPEVSHFSTDDLILDACFIIHVMDYIVDEKKSGLAIRPHLLPLVVEDMFLLENQVPFRALECAMKCLGMKAKVMITEFVYSITESPSAPLARNLLQYWEDICGCNCALVDIAAVALSLGHLRRLHRQRWVRHINLERFWEQEKPFHLLQILRAHLLSYSEEGEPEPQPYLWHPPRCATELKTAGISFERRWTYSLEDARFEKGIIFVRLSLPSITQLTKRRFVSI